MFQAKFMPITVLEVLQHCHLTLSMHKMNQGLYVQNPRCLNSHLKPLLKLCSSMLAVYIYDNPQMLIPYIIYSGNSTKYDISVWVKLVVILIRFFEASVTVERKWIGSK